jgi:hypothetical protein
MKLSMRMRRALPKADFAIKSKAPASGSYPLPDASHARSALSLVAQHGTPKRESKSQERGTAQIRLNQDWW